MVTIVRSGYAFGTVNASPDEWQAIKGLVRYAESIYRHTELHYKITGPEDGRRGKLKDLIEAMDHVWENPPIELHSDQIHTIGCCVREMDGRDVPVAVNIPNYAVIEQFFDLHVVDIFDDQKATQDQLDRWGRDLRSEGG